MPIALSVSTLTAGPYPLIKVVEAIPGGDLNPGVLS